MTHTFEGRRDIYAHAWHDLAIDADKVSAFGKAAHMIVAGREHYERISAKTGVPWPVIGLAHLRESDCDFHTHLHNGDPLTGKTYHDPAGRPPGSPPFDFDYSAGDALHIDGLDKFVWDSVERIAFALESFNGFGYANHGVPSAYLWAGTNQYRGGKFVADRVFDPHAIDRQLGAMGVLKRIEEIVPGCIPAATVGPEIARTSYKAKTDEELASALSGSVAGSWAAAVTVAQPLAIQAADPPSNADEAVAPPMKPKPSVSLVSIAYRSRTVNALMVFLATIAGWLGDAAHWIGDVLGGLFDMFPQVADQVRQNLSVGEELAGWFGANWRAIETTVALVSIVVAIALLLRDKQKAAAAASGG